jgi:hypothetical protein
MSMVGKVSLVEARSLIVIRDWTMEKLLACLGSNDLAEWR